MTTLAVTFPGGWELIAILFIFVLLFGAKKLPELGSSIGSTIKNFKKGVADADDESDEADEAAETAADESSPASRDNS